MNTMATDYTKEAARREYAMKLRRAAVLELLKKFGISESNGRCLIEGDEAPVKGRPFAGQTRMYFDREEVLKQV